MKSIKADLRRLRAEHQAARYGGDLAGDVWARLEQRRRQRRWLIGAAGGVAAAAAAIMVVIFLRPPDDPHGQIASVAPAPNTQHASLTTAATTEPAYSLGDMPALALTPVQDEMTPVQNAMTITSSDFTLSAPGFSLVSTDSEAKESESSSKQESL